MTMIHTSDDLLTLLDENEEFRDAVRQAILTEELLTLPAVFADFASEVRADIRELKDGQRRHTNDIGELKDGQDELRDGQRRHTDDIGELKGIGLENRLYNRGPSHIATLLRVYDVARIRVAEKDDNSEEFNASMRQALESDVITLDEYDRVLITDMIVSALRPGASNQVYTAIEASYSVTRDDIRKVKETARILGRVFPDAEVHAALYYMNMAAFIEAEAVEQGIHLIRVRSLR